MSGIMNRNPQTTGLTNLFVNIIEYKTRIQNCLVFFIY